MYAKGLALANNDHSQCIIFGKVISGQTKIKQVAIRLCWNLAVNVVAVPQQMQVNDGLFLPETLEEASHQQNIPVNSDLHWFQFCSSASLYQRIIRLEHGMVQSIFVEPTGKKLDVFKRIKLLSENARMVH